ncbi:hypothetical protein KHM25_18570 [Leptospira borgpetersenii]|nr:hypothetical protein KHM25_18570 [Leptospira borgpetersenii]
MKSQESSYIGIDCGKKTLEVIRIGDNVRSARKKAVFNNRKRNFSIGKLAQPERCNRFRSRIPILQNRKNDFEGS